MLSVLIPARNEIYLGKTIESVLFAAKGDIEVIAICDGYRPDPPITINDKRVRLVYNADAVGQRQAINQAARLAQGKYILKCDAHTMFDEGFDVKLAANCEPDWTVIPRMYNLDVEKWQPKFHKVTDFMWINGPDAPNSKNYKRFRVYYWDAPTAREFPEEYEAFKNAEWTKGDICDVMTGQGACWFMHKDRFWELGGLDEATGHWGQMGIEIALKSWLSGGRQVVNKKTWFAHWFRGGEGPGFPWPASGHQQELARIYSRNFWTSGRWPLQKYPLDWLAQKFAPVPNWNGQAGKVITTKETDKATMISVLIPARNERYLQRTIDDLATKLKLPYEVLVGLDAWQPDPPLREQANLKIYYSSQRVGTRVLINKLVSMAQGKYLLRLDPHCIVAEGLDEDLISVCDTNTTVVPSWYELDTGLWQRRENTRCDYRYLTHPGDHAGGLRSVPWNGPTKSEAEVEVDEVMTCSGSIWLMEKQRFLDLGGLDERHGHIGQEGVEIACKSWLSGGKLLVNKRTWYAHWNRNKHPYALGRRQKQISLDRANELWLKGTWPQAVRDINWLIRHFANRLGPVPGWSLKDVDPPAKQRATYKSSYRFKRRTFEVAELYDNYAKYIRSYKQDPSDPKSTHHFHESFRPFVDSLLSGKKYNEVQLKQLPYYHYLCSHLNPARREDFVPDKIGLDRVLWKMCDAVKLVYSIRDHGIQAPIDLWRDRKENQWVLQRGNRRIVIAHKLGIKTIQARLWANRDVYNAGVGRFDVRSGGLIEQAAMRQFAQYGRLATDKYYVHNYTHYYDTVLGNCYKAPLKILEIGARDGASLALWKEVFPKATVYGLDLKQRTAGPFWEKLEGVKVFIGDQADKDFLQKEVIPAGPFDVIIDDGSHLPKPTLTSLETLWPSLNPFGWYVIEDLWHTVHHSGERDLLMGKLCQMNNSVQSSGDVLAMNNYLNICFIQKA